MMINSEVKIVIDKSVLCWLATSNEQNEPNVSPKEMFTYQDEKTLLIANIASPNSVQNIMQNSNVCVSFVDVFTQKGFKLKGTAIIIPREAPLFLEKKEYLTALFSDKYPIQGIIEITINRVERIIAPSYYLFSDTTEEGQIESAMKTYGVKSID